MGDVEGGGSDGEGVLEGMGWWDRGVGGTMGGGWVLKVVGDWVLEVRNERECWRGGREGFLIRCWRK